MARIPTLAATCAFGAAALFCVRPALADQSSLPPEVGYHYGESEDARWLAMGGALRAMGNGITGIFANPAALTQTQVYHAGGVAQIWPEARRQSYGGALMDSVTNRLAAGVGYTWTAQDPDGLKRKSSDFRLALAFPISDKVSFGVTGRYLELTQNGLGPLGQSYASGGLYHEAIVKNYSFDAGVRVSPNENVSFGLVGTNLSNPGTGFQPTTVGGGIGVGNQDVVVEGDVVADFTTWQRTTTRAMGGFEFLASGHFPLRLGYSYDDGGKLHGISGGLGYIDTQFALEVSARRMIGDWDATTIGFTLQYFVESSGMTASPTSGF